MFLHWPNGHSISVLFVNGAGIGAVNGMGEFESWQGVQQRRGREWDKIWRIGRENGL